MFHPLKQIIPALAGLVVVYKFLPTTHLNPFECTAGPEMEPYPFISDHFTTFRPWVNARAHKPPSRGTPPSTAPPALTACRGIGEVGHVASGVDGPFCGGQLYMPEIAGLREGFTC
jgi:hypothetical protein